MHYLTEDYPPSNYLDNGELKGIAVELLKVLWSEMGVAEQKIQVLPWARAYARALEEPDCVLFATTRSPERENLFKWVGPIYQGNYSLYSNAAKPIPLHTIEEARQYRIGVIRADFSEMDLLAKGVPCANLYPLDSVAQLTRMLFTGRIDLLYLYSETLNAFAPLVNAKKSDFFLSLTISENKMYYAFSRSTDNALISRFQIALNAAEARRREIVLRYNCTP